uniref:Secreted protein n=1 Tax=Caenorhabditis japonica TaxID=281687 RepID=A0A8R1HRN2_CAEJA
MSTIAILISSPLLLAPLLSQCNMKDGRLKSEVSTVNLTNPPPHHRAHERKRERDNSGESPSRQISVAPSRAVRIAIKEEPKTVEVTHGSKDRSPDGLPSPSQQASIEQITSAMTPIRSPQKQTSQWSAIARIGGSKEKKGEPTVKKRERAKDRVQQTTHTTTEERTARGVKAKPKSEDKTNIQEEYMNDQEEDDTLVCVKSIE